MTAATLPRPITLTVLAALALARPAWTAPEPLLNLVPDGAGFGVLVRNLRSHWADLRAAPLLEELAASPLGARLLAAPELKKVQAAEKRLQQHLGVDFARLRDDLFGDAVVLAFYPGPPGRPDQDHGLLLLRARDPQLLADLCSRLDKAQKESGELTELTEREHKGARYLRRVEAKGEQFYYRNGPLLAFTSREELLHRVIERDRRSPGDPSAPLAVQLGRLGTDEALAVQWLNPRAFDAALQAKIAAARGPEAAVLKTWDIYWKSLDGLALSLALPRAGVELRLALATRTDELPAAARRLLAEAAQPSALWERFPDTALVAVAGRLDLAALAALLGEFLPDDSRKEVRAALDRVAGAALGKDVLTEVLPRLGPDWGLCLVAPPAAEVDPLPLGVWALRVRAGDGGDDVGPALLGVLNTLATLAVVSHNGQAAPADRLALRTAMQDRVEVKYVGRTSAVGPRPAFALKDGYLVLGTSPEAVRRFAAAAPPPPSDEVPLLRIGLRAWRQYLKERRPALAEYVAARQQVTTAEADQRLDGLASALAWTERLELVQRSSPGQVAWVLRLRTEKPLRK